MKSFRFTIPLYPTSKEWGMNGVYAQEKHWAKRKDQAHTVHALVRARIRRQNRNVQRFDKPVVVWIYYNSRLDIDNHGYLSKLIIDGMKGLLIEDDDRRFVRGLYQGFHSGDPGIIIVEVEEQ